MNLKDTFSKMLKREVLEDEARVLASTQFGALSAYLKRDLITENNALRTKISELKFVNKLTNI